MASCPRRRAGPETLALHWAQSCRDARMHRTGGITIHSHDGPCSARSGRRALLPSIGWAVFSVGVLDSRRRLHRQTGILTDIVAYRIRVSRQRAAAGQAPPRREELTTRVVGWSGWPACTCTSDGVMMMMMMMHVGFRTSSERRARLAPTAARCSSQARHQAQVS